MKIHISRVYGISGHDKTIEAQIRMSNAARSIDFYEMGIYRYPVNTDSETELHKRIDGIIAAVEPHDTVFLQLPTGNGEHFESILISKLNAYQTNLILIFHDENAPFFSAYNSANKVYVPTKSSLENMISAGLTVKNSNILSFQTIINQIILKKQLIDACSEYIDDSSLSSSDTISICFAVHDRTGNYCSNVGATMQSVIENTASTIHFNIFIDDTITSSNQDKLRYIANNRGHKISFHKVDISKLQLDNPFLQSYSVASLFRLLIPETLSEQPKTIYMDADLLVFKDVNELWQLDLRGNAIAAVKDIGFSKGIAIPKCVSDGLVDLENYFNSGLIVMDLNKIRSLGSLSQMCLKYLESEKTSSLPDQDALNVIFSHKTYMLDSSWNVFTKYERHVNPQLNKYVYHYAGENYISFTHPTEYDKEYLNVKSRANWTNAPISDLIWGLGSAYDHVNILQEALAAVSDSCSKKKIYYGINTWGMINILKYTHPNAGDYFILADPNDRNGCRHGLPVKTFEDLKNETVGEFIVFVLAEADNGQAINKLNNLGLQHGKDFFVIQRILTVDEGGFK